MIDFSNLNVDSKLRKISISSLLTTIITPFDSEGVAKVTVYLWLEGWDADYLDGLAEGSKIGATLEFALTK